MKTTLTKEEKAMLPVIRDKWINMALKGHKPIDTDAVDRLMGFLRPGSNPLRVYCKSPLGAQYAVALVGRLTKASVRDSVEASVEASVRDSVMDSVEASVRAFVMDSVGASVRDSVMDSVGASVRASVRDSVEASVGDSVEASVRAFVMDSVGASVRDSVWDSVGASVRDSVMDSVGASVWDSVGGLGYISPYGLMSWCSWVAYYDYFDKVCSLSTEEFRSFRDSLSESGVWDVVATEGVFAFSELPIAVRRNESGQLHSDQEAAIEWSDGWKLYAIRGVIFDHATWKKIIDQKFEIADLVGIENADQRAAAMSLMRPELILEKEKAVKINTGTKGTDLYRVPSFMDTGNEEFCLVMTCPSTGRKFLEWTPPEIGRKGDADLCQAHALGMSLEDYLVCVEA